MNLSLIGKSALVCGSTQGIGKACALEIASLGASVTLVARNEELLKKVIGELDTSQKQKHSYIAADFQNPEMLKEKVCVFLKDHQGINILVNNTGGPPGGPVIQAKTEEFVQAFSNHLLCNHILAQAVSEGMKKNGYGRIINIISTSVKIPIKGLGVSNTIRGAVASWAKTLAGELAPFGITVNNVLPGATGTARLQSLIDIRAKNAGIKIEEEQLEWLKEIPAGRFADPSEIANAVGFLASPAASYINGINLPVDGGRLGCL